MPLTQKHNNEPALSQSRQHIQTSTTASVLQVLADLVEINKHLMRRVTAMEARLAAVEKKLAAETKQAQP